MLWFRTEPPARMVVTSCRPGLRPWRNGPFRVSSSWCAWQTVPSPTWAGPSASPTWTLKIPRCSPSPTSWWEGAPRPWRAPGRATPSTWWAPWATVSRSRRHPPTYSWPGASVRPPFPSWPGLFQASIQAPTRSCAWAPVRPPPFTWPGRSRTWVSGWRPPPWMEPRGSTATWWNSSEPWKFRPEAGSMPVDPIPCLPLWPITCKIRVTNVRPLWRSAWPVASAPATGARFRWGVAL